MQWNVVYPSKNTRFQKLLVIKRAAKKVLDKKNKSANVKPRAPENKLIYLFIYFMH